MPRRCALLSLMMLLPAAGWRAADAPAKQSNLSALDNLPDRRLVSLLKMIAGKAGSNEVGNQGRQNALSFMGRGLRGDRLGLLA